MKNKIEGYEKSIFAIILFFASSLILYISCEKENMIPLVLEEDQENTYKRPTINTDKICCTSQRTYIYHPTVANKKCCVPSQDGNCLPCVVINGNDTNIQKLNSLLNQSPDLIATFFSSVDNYIGMFPCLNDGEYSEYLSLLTSGIYTLIEISHDSETNTYLYTFENINDKTIFGLHFSLGND